MPLPLRVVTAELIEVVVIHLQVVVLDEVILVEVVVIVAELVVVEIVFVELLVVLDLVVFGLFDFLTAEDVELVVLAALLALHEIPREMVRGPCGSRDTLDATGLATLRADSPAPPSESTRSIRTTPGGSMENEARFVPVAGSAPASPGAPGWRSPTWVNRHTPAGRVVCVKTASATTAAEPAGKDIAPTHGVRASRFGRGPER